MSEEKVITAAEMVTRLFTNIENVKVENGNRLVLHWRSVVESIYKHGKKLAAHSTIIDLKNGILLIETDHSGWIQLFHLYQDFILKGLKKNIPELNIKSLAFRLQGSSAAIVDETEIQNLEKKRLEDRFEKEEEKLREFENQLEKNEEKKELPEKLRNLFERFRDDMLTKNK